MEPVSNYINGRWQAATSGDFVDVVNPATCEVLARVSGDGAADIDLAIEAASAAFGDWRRTPPEERIQYLFKLKQLLEDHFDEIARVTTMENGASGGRFPSPFHDLEKLLKQKRLSVDGIKFLYEMSGNVMICQV